MWSLSHHCKEIQPVHSKGDQPWDFFGRNDAKAETSILWPPDAKNWLTRKDPDAGKDWRQEAKGMTEDEMVGWYHWLKGHEFESTPRVVMDRETWLAAVRGVTKSRTWLSNWTELNIENREFINFQNEKTGSFVKSRIFILYIFSRNLWPKYLLFHIHMCIWVCACEHSCCNSVCTYAYDQIDKKCWKNTQKATANGQL